MVEDSEAPIDRLNIVSRRRCTIFFSISFLSSVHPALYFQPRFWILSPPCGPPKYNLLNPITFFSQLVCYPTKAIGYLILQLSVFTLNFFNFERQLKGGMRVAVGSGAEKKPRDERTCLFHQSRQGGIG